MTLWSSIPSRLYPDKIIGRIETKGFETELHWSREGKDIYKHNIEAIDPNKNNWMFYVQPPLEG